MIVPSIVLLVPPPPSANRLWRKVSGRSKPILSVEYRRWLESAGWTARIALVGKRTITGAFDARIEVPEKSRRDRDNWTKPLFDLCQRVGAVANDRGLRRYEVVPAARADCQVELWDLGVPSRGRPP